SARYHPWLFAGGATAVTVGGVTSAKAHWPGARETVLPPTVSAMVPTLLVMPEFLGSMVIASPACRAMETGVPSAATKSTLIVPEMTRDVTLEVQVWTLVLPGEMDAVRLDPQSCILGRGFPIPVKPSVV